MLITERTSDGRTVVRLHKDWHPGRLGLAWIPPMRVYEQPLVERLLQTEGLKKFKRRLR
jgi:hypothetical protein